MLSIITRKRRNKKDQINHEKPQGKEIVRVPIPPRKPYTSTTYDNPGYKLPVKTQAKKKSSSPQKRPESDISLKTPDTDGNINNKPGS